MGEAAGWGTGKAEVALMAGNDQQACCHAVAISKDLARRYIMSSTHGATFLSISRKSRSKLLRMMEYWIVIDVSGRHESV